MDITGLKKLDNYIRRQEEQSQWEASANAEDIEFFRCQEQLQEQLLTQHTQVERVIGESVFQNTTMKEVLGFDFTNFSFFSIFYHNHSCYYYTQIIKSQ